MDKYIGIDLGTSGIKVLLVMENGEILNEVSSSYPCLHLEENYSEQEPNLWYTHMISCLKQLLIHQDKNDIKAISFGGQMHGLVLLDENDSIIRPAIL